MKPKLGRNTILLGLILIFFLFTRLFKITDIPSSVYWDEASIGYNAYSVMLTGQDERGEFLPLHFRAFGEFKLPVYIYSVIPFIKLIGLNALAVRLPSVLYFLLALILTYLIALKLKFGEKAALFSTFFMAVTPWIFIFSRTGFEASAGLALYLAGIYFFLKSNESKLDMLFSSASFIISIYSYNSFRLVSPLTFIILVFYQFIKNDNKFKINTKFLLSAVVLILIAYIPIIKVILYDYGSLRYQALSIQGSLFGRTIQFLNNYISHFSPNYLFLKGDPNLRHQLSGYGQLFFVSLPLLLAGLYRMVKEKKAEYYLILLLFLNAPIPASLVIESPHSLRSIGLIFGFSIIAGIGFSFLVETFSKYQKILSSGIIFMYLFSFESYYVKFVSDYNQLSSKDWQYNYKVVYEDINISDYSNYKDVFISDDYGQPYIFYLFYNQIDPKTFWEGVAYNPPGRWGVSTVERIGRIGYFQNGRTEFPNGSVIYSSVPLRRGDGNWVKELKIVNGEKAFDVYQK